MVKAIVLTNQVLTTICSGLTLMTYAANTKVLVPQQSFFSRLTQAAIPVYILFLGLTVYFIYKMIKEKKKAK